MTKLSEILSGNSAPIWLSDRRGTVGIIFAVMLPVLALLFAVGLEYRKINRATEEIQAAADIAAVAAMSNVVTSSERLKTAEDSFKANLAQNQTDAIDIQHLDIQLEPTTDRLKMHISVVASIDSWLGSIVGYEKYKLNVKSDVVSGQKRLVNISVLFDVSDSMGLAATPEDRATMKDVSKINCEFACHVQRVGPKYTYKDEYGNIQPEGNLLDIARHHGILLRIDVAKSGLESLVDLAIGAEQKNVRVNMGLWGIGMALYSIVPMTSDLNYYKSNISKLVLGYGRPGLNAYTKLRSVLGSFVMEPVPQDGDRVALIVTDGLEDNGNTFLPNVSTFPMPVDVCAQIRARGYKIAVILTKYLEVTKPPPGQNSTGWDQFRSWVLPIYPDIEKNAAACADPGLFIKAESHDEIQQAFKSMFDSILYMQYIEK